MKAPLPGAPSYAVRQSKKKKEKKRKKKNAHACLASCHYASLVRAGAAAARRGLCFEVQRLAA